MGDVVSFNIVNVIIMSLRGDILVYKWGILQKGVPQCHSTALASMAMSLLRNIESHSALWSFMEWIQSPDIQSVSTTGTFPDSYRAIIMMFNQSEWASSYPLKLPQDLPWYF